MLAREFVPISEERLKWKHEETNEGRLVDGPFIIAALHGKALGLGLVKVPSLYWFCRKWALCTICSYYAFPLLYPSPPYNILIHILSLKISVALRWDGRDPSSSALYPLDSISKIDRYIHGWLRSSWAS